MNIVSNLSKWIKTKFQPSQKDEDSSMEYKILILGEHEVGKTSVCNRFIMNEFNLEIKPTKESECYTKNIQFFEEKLKIYIVDVDTNVMNTNHSYLYTDVKGAIVLYDVTKHKSFEKIDTWVVDMRQNISNKIPILIVDNKNDLSFLKCVHEIELKEKASSLNCDYMETSCTDADSVDKAIKFLVAKMYYLDLPENKQNYLKNYLS